jgi:hypothetical protein
MDFNFSEALRRLPAGSAFRVANSARPPVDYLFNSLLPERNEWEYQVSSGNMTVKATMAGMAAMDSPYPETGLIEATSFNESTCKIANSAALTEGSIRKLQQMLMQLAISSQPTVQTIQQEALNFLDKIIVQSHLDTTEWLRGQALAYGAIDWTFGSTRLVVDYGIPTANKLTARTGNDGYGGSASKFWDDVRTARRRLKNNVRAFIAHPNTIDMIRYNSVNNLVVVSEGQGTITFQKKQTTTDGSAINFLSSDSGDVVTLVSYGLEGEVYDPTNVGKTLNIPFMPVGKMIAIGNNAGTSYVVGAGSNPTPIENVLGYTHIAPTAEGGGRPGRWADVYVPEAAPWSFAGRGAANLLPVIEANEKIVIMTTDMV